MGKKCLLLFVMFSALLLNSCTHFAGASAGKIISPPNESAPFQGEWAVLETLHPSEEENDAQTQWEGSSVQFAKDAVAFGGQLWNHLTYKVKKVDAITYAATKNISNSAISFSESQKADVFTIYTESNYLGECMKIDDTTMVFFVQNNDLLLRKIADQAGSLKEDDTQPQEPNQQNSLTVSGVFLGLRTPQADNPDHYTYRTLWVTAGRQGLRSSLTSENLFFPRLSGFWECNVSTITTDGKYGNTLSAHNAFTAVPEAPEATNGAIRLEPSVRIINYIGNDYVCAETVTNNLRQLQVLPVDALSSSARVKVVDLLGINGNAVYENTYAEEVQALKNIKATAIHKDDLGENFGLVREKGHWKLVGRIDYLKDGAIAYRDFEIKSIPPHRLIFYDTLALNWHHIKDRVPDALDAFTSPDQNIAIVKTKNKLVIYPIGTEKLSENALGEIELAEDETVVMAEWATEIYVEPWEKAFRAYGGKEMPESKVRKR